MQDTENERVKVGAYEMQNRREDMQDAHVIIPDLDANSSLVGVFDGHGEGGGGVARFCAKHLPRLLLGNANFAKGDFCTAFHDVFMQMDRILRGKAGGVELSKLNQEPPLDDEASLSVSFDEVREIHAGDEIPSGGTTAVVALIRDDEVILANAGDSYCFLVMREGGEVKAIPLSRDHKGKGLLERHRICKAGGFVQDGYTCGGREKGPGRMTAIGMSRSIGDFRLKMNTELSQEDQILIAAPDLVRLPLTRDCKYLVLASDGLHKRSSTYWAQNPNNAPSTLSDICETVLNLHSTSDNSTLVIVELKKASAAAERGDVWAITHIRNKVENRRLFVKRRVNN